MPLVDFDVRTVPDIIEAQLTLSYSRLSDIIRIIVEQGNGHEDDIEEMRRSITTLTQNCASLQGEVDELKGQASNKDMVGTIEELRKTVLGLSENVADLTQKHAQEVAERQEVEKQFQTTMDTTVTTLKALEAQTNLNTAQLKNLEQSLAAVQSFTDLWNGDSKQISVLARRDEKDPSQFEHTVDERTEYVLSLPSFDMLREELQVLRSMINTQATNAIKMKADRSASDARGAIAELQETLEGLGKRLCALENAKPEGSKTVATSSTNLRDSSGGNPKEASNPSLVSQKNRGANNGDAASNVIAEDLANRVLRLETTVSLIKSPSFDRSMVTHKNGYPQSNGSNMRPGSSNSAHSSTIAFKKELHAKDGKSLSNGSGTQNGDLIERIEGLELTTGLLDENKADRQELYALEEAINQMFQRDSQLITPQRPSSAKLPRISHTGASRVGEIPLSDTQGAAYEGMPAIFPKSSAYGRPLFVSHSSINLRDGVQMSSATITPVQRQ